MVTTLWLGMISSALGVVYIRHDCRDLYAQLSTLGHRSNQLQIEWGQLLLEQSYLASFARIEQLATDKLAMRAPHTNEIVVVSP